MLYCQICPPHDYITVLSVYMQGNDCMYELLSDYIVEQLHSILRLKEMY